MIDPAHVRTILEKRVSIAQDSAMSNEVMEVALDLNTAYPPASSPGQPPHRRTGALQEGVKQETEITEDYVISTLDVDRLSGNRGVPMFLEFGTSKMAPRPFMRPSYERVKAAGLAAIAKEART